MNEQGVAASRMNDGIKNLIDSGTMTYSQALPFLTDLRVLSDNQRALMAWAAPIDGIPPNEIGDVGSIPSGNGPVRFQDMSFGNWRYYQQNNLAPKWATIFAGTVEQL